MPYGYWNLESPVARPTPRSQHAMAYNIPGSEIILFGGWDGAVALGDTWIYTVGNWTQVFPVTNPPAKFGHCMLTRSDAAYIYGGIDDLGIRYTDLCYWDAVAGDWVVCVPIGPAPPARNHAGMALDANDDLVLFGGITASGGDSYVYIWDILATEWMVLTPNTNPEQRYEHAMYFDTALNAIVMFGGRSALDDRPLSDVWTWTNSDWQLLDVGASIGPRSLGQGMAYDKSCSRGIAPHCGEHATGTITCVYRIYLDDGETFTLNDGLTAAVTYEFDDDAAVTPGNVAVDISAAVTPIDVRDAIITAVNGSGANLRAYTDEDNSALVNLINMVAGPHGNQHSDEDVTQTAFVVSDMEIADASTWEYLGLGNHWMQSEISTVGGQPQGLRHAASVYDEVAEVVRTFGGERYGLLRDEQYAWTFNWALFPAPPYYSYPGALQERVQPAAVDPQEGSWAMVLGEDREELQSYKLDIGDTIEVRQAALIDGRKLLQFDWRMRYSPRMPKYSKVLDNGVVSFLNGDLITAGDALLGVRKNTVALFSEEHVEQLISMSGGTNPANRTGAVPARISSIPSAQKDSTLPDLEVGWWDSAKDQGNTPAGSVAVIEHAGMVDALNDPGVTLEVLGAQWRAEMLISVAGVEQSVVSVVEQLVQFHPDGWQRGSLKANLSKYSGVAEIIFRLTLESVTA